MKKWSLEVLETIGLPALLGLYLALNYCDHYGDYSNFIVVALSVCFSIWLFLKVFRLVVPRKSEKSKGKGKIVLDIVGTFLSCYIGALIPLAILDFKFWHIHFLKTKPALATIILFVIIFGMMIGFTYALRFSREARERERTANALRSLAVEAELRALRSQINPHFLFNVLNSINSLISQNPPLARKMIVRLSDLLRMVLDGRDQALVPLKQELGFARAYLEIEGIRFKERLAYHEDVEPGLEDRLFPAMILQPLLENAVRYGIAGCRERGMIRLSIRLLDGRVHCVIANPAAPGRSKDQPIVERTGLTNIRQRLSLLYKNEATFEAGWSEDDLFEVHLSIPQPVAS